MKKNLTAIAVLALICGSLLAFSTTRNTGGKPDSKLVYTQLLSCSPDRNYLAAIVEDLDIPPIPGAGRYQWPIDTDSDSAQFYFNQGINTYYSFHIIEALASFQKAARFDSSNAILYWAQALAYGPNINDFNYAIAPEAVAAAAKALKLSVASSAKDKMLIEVMALRYSTETGAGQTRMNALYAAGMKNVFAEFPDDADVAALYADALMLQHPWDLWTHEGSPKPWTNEIRQVLERLLARTPLHPGVNHYYIHVMEPSPFADKALPSAERLGQLTPGLAHTVHMPSHIYLRTGDYKKGVDVNENALASYEVLKKVFLPASNDFLYSIHNRHMLVNNAMLAGNSSRALSAADELVASIPSDYLQAPGATGNYMQYVWMTPVLAKVRFAKWDQLLHMQQPATNLVYANLLYHWGRGMAYANTSKISQAEQEAVMVKRLMADSSLLAPFTPFSPAIDGATIALNMLQGTIYSKSARREDAIASLQQAVKTEMDMVYNEPRDWMLSPAHYLGQAYLEFGQPGNAAKVFSTDLLNNRENAWSLAGLLQGRSGQSAKGTTALRSRLKKACVSADIVINKAVL